APANYNVFRWAEKPARQRSLETSHFCRFSRFSRCSPIRWAERSRYGRSVVDVLPMRGGSVSWGFSLALAAPARPGRRDHLPPATVGLIAPALESAWLGVSLGAGDG